MAHAIVQGPSFLHLVALPTSRASSSSTGFSVGGKHHCLPQSISQHPVTWVAHLTVGEAGKCRLGRVPKGKHKLPGGTERLPYLYTAHFTDGETEAQWPCNLPRATPPVSDLNTGLPGSNTPSLHCPLGPKATVFHPGCSSESWGFFFFEELYEGILSVF